MSNPGEKRKHEIRELIPVTLFFFVAFYLPTLTDALIVKQYGIHATTFLAATLLALIVAKVVVLRLREPLSQETAHPQRPLEDIHPLRCRTRLPVSRTPYPAGSKN